MSTLTATARSHSRILISVVESATQIWSLCREQWALHRTRLELGHLDDRLLRDIGLDRRSVMLETAKPFWKR